MHQFTRFWLTTCRAVLLRQQSVLSLLLATANHIDVVQSVMSPYVLAYVYVIQIMNEMTINLGLRTVWVKKFTPKVFWQYFSRLRIFK